MAEERGGEIRIVEFAETPVAVLSHRGDPARIDETVRRFIAWRKAAGLPPGSSRTFNILHGDPDGPAEEFRLDLCAATDRAVQPNDAGVVAGRIPGGRCAVRRHIGADDGLDAAIASLYRDWLPASGEALRDFPVFLQRVTLAPDESGHAVIDIFLPLE
jgi:AraC family transcriptional regulator